MSKAEELIFFLIVMGGIAIAIFILIFAFITNFKFWFMASVRDIKRSCGKEKVKEKLFLGWYIFLGISITALILGMIAYIVIGCIHGFSS